MKTGSVMLLIVAVAMIAGCASSGTTSRNDISPAITGKDLLGNMARTRGPDSLIELGRAYADDKYPLKGEAYTQDPLGVIVLRAQLIKDVVNAGIEGMNSPGPRGGLYRLPIPLTSLEVPVKWSTNKQELPEGKDFFIRFEMKGVAPLQASAGELPINYFVRFDLSREFFRNVAVTQSEYERIREWYEEGNEQALKSMISPDHDLYLEFRPAFCDGRFYTVTCEMQKPSVHDKNYKPRMTVARTLARP